MELNYNERQLNLFCPSSVTTSCITGAYSLDLVSTSYLPKWKIVSENLPQRSFSSLIALSVPQREKTAVMINKQKQVRVNAETAAKFKWDRLFLELPQFLDDILSWLTEEIEEVQ